jgi:hypothetical protein
MSKVSTIGIGAGGLFTSQQQIPDTSKYFTSEGLSGALGTEIAQGTFEAEDGLAVFDTNPVFTVDSGELSAAFNNTSPLATNLGVSAITSPSAPPSTGPYVWKYQ